MKLIKDIVLILGLWIGVADVKAQQWQKFSPPEQLFEILTPGLMRNGEKKIMTDIGNIHPVTWLYQGIDNDPNYLYMVSYINYPEGAINPDSISLISEIFNVSIATQTKDLDGDLVYQAESPYGNYPGMVYRIAYSQNKYVLKAKMIMQKDRLFILQVYTTTERSLNSDMDKFLDSFKILTR